MIMDELYLLGREEDSESLQHYGRSKLDGAEIGSGRYPLGSGEYPFQRDPGFEARRNQIRKEHPDWNNTQIAKEMGMSTNEFRAKVTINRDATIMAQTQKAVDMFNHGYSKSEIGRQLGISEGKVRTLLKPKEDLLGRKTATSVALELKDLVDSKGMLDIGSGVEIELGISPETLTAAAHLLKESGYSLINNIQVPQATNPNKYTVLRVLAPPGTTKSYAFNNMEDISSVVDYDAFEQEAMERHPGFERTKYGMYYPQSIDSSRVYIRSPKEGGAEEDGVIYIRRGVKDLSLGKSNYAQVRIGVDDKMYMKGIALYGDDADFPKGKDVIYCSSKPDDWGIDDVLKPYKTKTLESGKKVVDRDNVFGAAIKPEEKDGQRFYIGDDGKEHLSAINIVGAEGDWMNWKKRLSSQFLSKQPMPLIKQQLDISYQTKLNEYEDIMKIENPTIKQKYLWDFANDCDASAVHLKAAALPGQSSRLLLPVPDLPDGTCYCPGYKTGDTVVLIRHPHAGTFEIPVLKVNNNFKSAKDKLGNAVDAIGINHKAAQQLSGADFDGDTALVIPISKGGVGTKIKYDDPLPGLKNWSPDQYQITDKKSPLYQVDPEHGFRKQDEMGKISNLITDMTIIGAQPEEITRAVKYSMVVIDAEKHHLDWRQCKKDCKIKELYKQYQGNSNGAAATLISRAKSPIQIPKRTTDYGKDNPNIKNGVDITTGERTYKPIKDLTYHKPIYVYERDENGLIKKDKNGRKIVATVTEIDPKTGKLVKKKVIEGYEEKETIKKQDIYKMTNALETTGDAKSLMSPFENQQELAYANYANQLYALANRARKEYATTEPIKKSKEASIEYQEEVDALNEKIDNALKNAPRERQAQLYANWVFKNKKQDNPNMSGDEEKKIKSQALAEARVRFGAKKDGIDITDRELDAIQSGAISSSQLTKILDNMTKEGNDKLRERVMPKDYKTTLTTTKEDRIRSMERNGYGIEEIANAIGVSASTVSRFLMEDRGDA